MEVGQRSLVVGSIRLARGSLAEHRSWVVGQNRSAGFLAAAGRPSDLAGLGLPQVVQHRVGQHRVGRHRVGRHKDTLVEGTGDTAGRRFGLRNPRRCLEQH